MHKVRINELAEHIRQEVFALLDGEPDITGDEAGYVAHVVEVAFHLAIQRAGEAREENGRVTV